MKLLLDACARLGVQEKTPRLGWTPAPAGPASNWNVIRFVGISGSITMLVTRSGMRTNAVWPGTGTNVGAVFTSFTTTVTICVALKLGEPSSVTMTLIEAMPGPCCSDGVHVSKPLVELMAAP